MHFEPINISLHKNYTVLFRRDSFNVSVDLFLPVIST